jgi:hypothetical protein
MDRKPSSATCALGPTFGIDLYGQRWSSVGEVRNNRVGGTNAGASRAFMERSNLAILYTAVTGSATHGAIL